MKVILSKRCLKCGSTLIVEDEKEIREDKKGKFIICPIDKSMVRIC